MSFLETIKSELHTQVSRACSRYNEYVKWRSHGANYVGLQVFYGHNRIPLRDEKASGGIIKCQDLQRRFPNKLQGSNLLYLVSSSLPPYPEYLIHHAKRKGLRLVWNQNGVAYPAWHGLGWEQTNRPLMDSLHQSDYVIYQSEFCKVASEKFLGKYNGPSIILHNPVDTSHFLPGKRKPEGCKVLLAGTHNEWYRVASALRAFRHFVNKIPDAELIIGGPLRWHGEEHQAKSDVDALLKELSIERRVHLRGPYSQEYARTMFQSAHILLHTQYNDACPRLVVEAMSCGLPVVYSSTGGTPELVGTEAGIGIKGPLDWNKIHEADAMEMAEALSRVYQDYDTFSCRARKRAVEHFDVSSWLDAHERIFYSLLK